MEHLDLIQKIFLAFYFFQIIFLTVNSWAKRKTLGLGTIESVIVPGIVVAALVATLNFYSTNNYVLEVIGFSLFVAGTILGGYAFRHLTFTNSDDFWIARNEEKKRFFVSSGPYAVIRHPIFSSLALQYLGVVLILFHPITIGLWFIAAIYAVYTALAEEKFMASKFPEYVEYQKQTDRFIPKIF